jgi:hypothetical protein
VLIIPLDNHNVTLMALQVLVHRQIATTLAFARLKFNNFEQTLVATRRKIALFLVPADDVQHGILGHADLEI